MRYCIVCKKQILFGYKYCRLHRDEATAKGKLKNTIQQQAIRKIKIDNNSICAACGTNKTRLERHHNDYNKPLDITILCIKCHRIWHKNNKAEVSLTKEIKIGLSWGGPKR